MAGAAEGGEEEGMSEKLTGISSSGQELIKRHNFDPDLIDYIREKEQRITEFLNHAEALEAEKQMLWAKFRLDVGILLENNRVLTEQRGALKEQLSETNKMYNQQIEYYNRDQSFIEHQNNEIRKMESRIAEAEKHLEKLASITDKVMNTEPYGALLEWEGGMKSALRGIGEDSAMLDLKEGRVKTFKNTEDLFKDLDGVESEEEGKS